MTYPRPETQRFLTDHVVAYKAHLDQHAALARRFHVQWTPGLVWLTPEGEPAHQNVGYFEPEEFLAESLYGCARVAAAEDDWQTARARFEETAQRWPRSHAAPAALYWSAVAAKKATGRGEELLAPWRKLLDEYPGDAWAMKVSFLGEPTPSR